MKKFVCSALLMGLVTVVGCEGNPQPVKSNMPASKEGPKGGKGKASSVSDSADDLPKVKK
jgi:hypothetical protein